MSKLHRLVDKLTFNKNYGNETLLTISAVDLKIDGRSYF